MSATATAEHGTLVSNPPQIAIGLAGAVLLRTVMKNNPTMRERVIQILRQQAAALGLKLDEAVWDELVIASATELEHSRAHVIE